MLSRRSFLGSVPALYGWAKNQMLGAGRREFHVAAHGNDAHLGAASHPLRTISAFPAISTEVQRTVNVRMHRNW